jgi:excisionase family DNA binding protein
MIKRNPAKNSQRIRKRKEAHMESTLENSIMTVAEAAEYLKITKQAVALAIKRGHLEITWFKDSRYLLRHSVLAYKPRPYLNKRKKEIDA